jgi:hypothetical protein
MENAQALAATATLGLTPKARQVLLLKVYTPSGVGAGPERPRTENQVTGLDA